MNAKYYIYFNLHKKCYSVKYRGKVIKHFNYAIVYEPEFKVSATGRERVRREGVKNVHAYIVSSDIVFLPAPTFIVPKVTVKYNPYKNESFVDNRGNALYNAKEAHLSTFECKPVISIVERLSNF